MIKLIKALPLEKERVLKTVDRKAAKEVTEIYFEERRISFVESVAEMRKIERPNKTITIFTKNRKGGSTKTTITENLLNGLNIVAQKFFSADKPLRLGIITADRNQGLVKRFTDKYLKNHYSPNLKIYFIGVEYEGGEEKSMHIINTEIHSKIKRENKLTPVQKAKLGIDPNQKPTNTYYVEEESDLTVLDFVSYDLAAGTNELETYRPNHVLVPCKVAETESIDNAFNDLEEMVKEQHERLMVQLDKAGKKKDIGTIVKAKELGGIKHTLIVNDSTNKKSFKSTMKYIEARLQEICSMYQENIALLVIPYFPFDVFRNLNINPFIPVEQFQAYKHDERIKNMEGVYLGRIKCIEERPDVVESINDLVQRIGG